MILRLLGRISIGEEGKGTEHSGKKNENGAGKKFWGTYTPESKLKGSDLTSSSTCSCYLCTFSTVHSTHILIIFSF